jgi:quercetin dioxygenase-like cupin family protein
MTESLIISGDMRNRPLDVGGFEITVLASDAETSGYEVFYISGPEGKGPGPHFHPWDESFFVLHGEIHCGVDGVEALSQAGSFIHVPGGSTHWFLFGKGGAAMLSITSKGNASKMFTDFASGISWDNPDRDKLIALAAQYGQIILKPKT